MKGIPREQLPVIKTLIKENGILVLPLIVIVWLLMSGFTPFLAAFWGIISSVAFTQTGPKTKNFFVAVCSTIPCVLFQWNPFEGPAILTALWVGLYVRRADLHVSDFAVYPLDLGNHRHCHPRSSWFKPEWTPTWRPSGPIYL